MGGALQGTGARRHAAGDSRVCHCSEQKASFPLNPAADRKGAEANAVPLCQSAPPSGDTLAKGRTVDTGLGKARGLRERAEVQRSTGHVPVWGQPRLAQPWVAKLNVQAIVTRS